MSFHSSLNRFGISVIADDASIPVIIELVLLLMMPRLLPLKDAKSARDMFDTVFVRAREKFC